MQRNVQRTYREYLRAGYESKSLDASMKTISSTGQHRHSKDNE